MKKITAIALFALVSLSSYAQYFLPPLDGGMVTMSKNVYAVTTSGDTIRGRINSAVLMNGQMRSFTIKAKDKTKHKLKAEMVKLLAVEPTDFMNLTSAASVPNLRLATSIDMNEVMHRVWVFYEQALLPNKDKYALMQLLNSGFDSKIKVYLNPNAGKTMTTETNGMNIIGGEDTSYIIVYAGGEKTQIVKKSGYKRDGLTEVFKDCPEFEEAYGGEKFRWMDFSEHVLVYDQLCQD